MREKADSDLVRRQNRRLVLDTLRQQGPLARIELGRFTGLSPATITSLTGQLIADGVVIEHHERSDGPTPARRGRPLVHLALNPSATAVLAVKISIAGLDIAAAAYDGSPIARQEVEISTYSATAADFGLQVAQEIRSFLARHRIPRQRIAHIGLAVQGAADSNTGTIMWSPAFRARNIPVTGPVQRKLGIACTLSNDANMMAEAMDRGGLDGTSAVIFMGYGVGMGLIINGRVYHGPTGAAAEFGHMNHLPHGARCRCGRDGCIEAYAADYAILRHASGEREDLPAPYKGVAPDRMRALEASARNGDARAQAAYARAGEALGFGIARLAALLSPSRIVFGGPGSEAMDLIAPHMQRAFAEGVVEELRRQVRIDTIPIDTDMIITGTIASALRALDGEVFAAGPLTRAEALEQSA